MSRSTQPRGGRNTGRVRIAGVSGTGEFKRVELGHDLLVTGEDLSLEVSSLLVDLRPKITTRYTPLDQILQRATEGSLTSMTKPELVMFACEVLDNETLMDLRRLLTGSRLPVVAVLPAHASQRSALRARVQEVGALDCLLRDELSEPLLESVVAQARNHNTLRGRLTELRDRFALAIRGARDGMWEWDIARSRVFYSQRWRELLGLENVHIEASLDTWLDRVHPQDIHRLRTDLHNHIQGLSPVHENEHRIRDGHGQWRWVLSRAVIHRNNHGKALRVAGSLTDITQYRQREKMIREQSRRDQLTQLPEKPVLFERLARAVELARSHDDFEFIMLLVETDRLAQIRDSFGLATANAMLALMAKRLRACVRPEDLLFRFSAHKFAILLENVEDASVGTHVADRIHQALSEPFDIEGERTFTTVSIGMTSSANGYRRVEEVIADVSAATDTARDRGRNRHEIYDTSMRIEARTLLALEMALRRAIDEDQLSLHFQPIVRVDPEHGERDTVAFESLMRWDHPERGPVSPGEFIPLAEDTGLIIPMGRWAIREAVRRLQRWRREFGMPDLAVSVNLSAKQVADPKLLETVDNALQESGLPGRCLKLELTESVMLDRADEVMALLQDIRDRGIEIWIDDFGTGYSSLSYLHRFPVDGLKVDRSFVSQLDGSEESETMVRTILNLASNMQLRVVAEGIETEVQAEQLTRLGCGLFQGWLFARPLPVEKVREHLKG